MCYGQRLVTDSFFIFQSPIRVKNHSERCIMAGGDGLGIMEIVPKKKTVYIMRHGQTKFGSNDPSLIKRGYMQVVEASQNYLTNINLDAIYRGIHIRHAETAVVAKVTLGLSCDIFETPMLSLTSDMNDAANKCAAECLKHPDGPAVGFRVDTWLEVDSILMDNCFEQFENFLREIPGTEKNILAISSSPIIESATADPEKTWLLGECGIIKYTVDADRTILSSETIFEGFFEKPPQKNP